MKQKYELILKDRRNIDNYHIRRANDLEYIKKINNRYIKSLTAYRIRMTFRKMVYNLSNKYTIVYSFPKVVKIEMWPTFYSYINRPILEDVPFNNPFIKKFKHDPDIIEAKYPGIKLVRTRNVGNDVFNLPWNLHTITNRNHYLNKLNTNDYYDLKLLEIEYKKMYLWLKSIHLNYPYLKSFIEKTTSTNGQYSPYTNIDLWNLKCFGSPGRIEYLLKKAKAIANNFIKMAGYNDTHASNWIIAKVIQYKISKTNCNFKKVTLTKKDALKIAIITILTVELSVHRIFRKEEKDELTPMLKITRSLFIHRIVDLISDSVGNAHFVQNNFVDINQLFIINYTKMRMLLVILIKIKNGDSSELNELLLGAM